VNVVRRRLLLGFCAIAPEACAPGAGSPPGDRSCATPSSGAGLPYCLVGALSITFPNARELMPGEVLLRGVDDNSAAILARDAQGYFALSATCPHACCTVSLCGGEACGRTTPTPNDCAVALKGMLPVSGPAFLCPCHGSEFGPDGAVLKGPALSPLPSVRVLLGATDASVDLADAVDASVRFN